MKKIILFLFVCSTIVGQDYYFPPIDSDEWTDKPLSQLGWSPSVMNEVLDFLDTTGTKGFMILVDGKIVTEEYFNDFDKDKFWYWASAGKTLTASMIGLAQQEGLLDIQKSTSDYLGEGWTNMEPEKERNIKLFHNLSMSTGLDYKVLNQNCMDPECLNFRNEAGTHWYYHNAPYRLLLDVLDSVYDKRINQVTNRLIGDKIGMGGYWINYVRWGKTRDLARFGSFIAAGGRWGDDLKLDEEYYNTMINTSQEMNESYGYLWWLNGKKSYKLPGFDLVLDGPLIPTAPSDLYAALGKDDQKIYIVPSMNMVVIRVGEDAGDSNFAASSYDTRLWEKLSKLFQTTSVETELSNSIISPNPATDELVINSDFAYRKISIYDINGTAVLRSDFTKNIDISALAVGTYNLILTDDYGRVLIEETFIKSE